MAAHLDSDNLKAAVSGKTVTIDTPLGLPITVNYSANGLMTGTAGTALGVYLGAVKDRGRWHVRNGKLCQKWFKWLSGDLTCLTLRQEGGKIYWQSDEGQTGTASIETGPPAFDGVTASGLGVPIPPERDADGRRDADRAGTPSEEPAPQATPPAAVSKTWSKAVVVHKATPHPGTDGDGEPRLLHAVAPARRAQYTLASFAPVPPLPLANPLHETPAVAVAPEADPFEAMQLPMRRAADFSAKATLAYRWCHSNAFAKGPSAPTSGTRFAAPELTSVPSLLAVAQEQAYEGELPLHSASCLTEEPGINVMAKLPMPDGHHDR